jgi:uncharacterized protein
MQCGHAVYQGEVGHLRLLPREHGFHYPLAQYWLDCHALSAEALEAAGIGYERFAPLSYRRCDYLAGAENLLDAVWQKLRELGARHEPAQVFILTPLANWGVYFSPLTLYYCYDRQQQLSYLLAEVTNTPWNERHYYLQNIVAGQQEYQHAKGFHVSPFHPMEMQYHWHIASPAQTLSCSIRNTQAGKQIFSAWIRMQRFELTASWKRRWLIRHPWQNVQVILRIHWHALKLFIKGVPVHAHPNTKDNNA